MRGNWKTLEDHVIGIASLRWGVACGPEHIDGVDFDCVVRVSREEIILIEITKERTLEKVRADINKISPTKLRLATQGIICRGFVILENEPTNSMTEAGNSAFISILSSESFEKSFFDFNGYSKLREKLPFGSAIDSKTGENDKRLFIPVAYSDAESPTRYKVSDLSNRLLKGTQITLTGDFGTGKSRCVREVYEELSKKTREAGAFPIAINLRDHWSSSNALEVLAGHLGNIGLSSSIDNFIRLLNSGHLILLLDGFDEIGAQSHDFRVDDRKALRRHAVRGVRDLIQKTKAGVLVTGRSHFFDSDEEMLQSLGLMTGAKSDVLLLSSPDSFTQPEGEYYFKALGIDASLPEWLPRKPLVFQVLVELDKNDVTRILSKKHGEFEFWGTFINAVCIRESKGVSESIAPQTIKLILYGLASKSRHSESFLGRLSARDIDESYERAVGTAPDQTGRQLLSRMCALGRIEPESPERQFVDYNVVDILRAECLVMDAIHMSTDDTKKQWRQSLKSVGTIHAACMIRAFDLEHSCFSYLHKFGGIENTKRLGELVSILTIFGTETLDFQGLQIAHSEIPILNLSHKKIQNLKIRESLIGYLALDNTPVKNDDALIIDESLATIVTGVSSDSGLPDWITRTEVVDFDRLSNSSRIKESPLLASQKLLLSIIHKIFFQSGAGREESALLKGGYGQRYSPKLVDSILKILMKEKLVERFKGRDGWVYTPVRRHSERMSRIKSELTLSDDTIWKEVSELSMPSTP